MIRIGLVSLEFSFKALKDQIHQFSHHFDLLCLRLRIVLFSYLQGFLRKLVDIGHESSQPPHDHLFDSPQFQRKFFEKLSKYLFSGLSGNFTKSFEINDEKYTMSSFFPESQASVSPPTIVPLDSCPFFVVFRISVLFLWLRRIVYREGDIDRHHLRGRGHLLPKRLSFPQMSHKFNEKSILNINFHVLIFIHRLSDFFYFLR